MKQLKQLVFVWRLILRSLPPVEACFCVGMQTDSESERERERTGIYSYENIASRGTRSSANRAITIHSLPYWVCACLACVFYVWITILFTIHNTVQRGEISVEISFYLTGLKGLHSHPLKTKTKLLLVVFYSMEVILLNLVWKINLGSTSPTGCLDVGVVFHNGDKKGE